jgi:exopolyphosphatase/guanosine-5'-triphosphate,3'-diphosphate pyrophosphatase
VAARRAIDDEFDGLIASVLAKADAVVAVGGSAMVIAAGLRGLESPEAPELAGTSFGIADWSRECDRLLGMPRAQRRLLPYLHPGRVDVIGAGSMVWQAVGEYADRGAVNRIVVSPYDILDGIVMTAQKPERV